MPRLPLVLILSLFCSLALGSVSQHCLDRNGNPVAWFAIIKYPGALIQSNPRYAYIDENGNNELVIINKHADDDGEPLTNTIHNIQGAPHKLVFNDEPPGQSTSSSYAHAKGIIGYDDNAKSGVYIMHSLPLFPSVNNDGVIDNKFPDSAQIYGQHIYCVTMDHNIFQNVFNSLPIEKPDIYHASGMFQTLAKTSPQTSNIAQFNLINGENQYFFTKGPKFSGFLYEDIVIPHLDISMQVESWGRPYQAPACTEKYNSVNIKNIAFPNGDTWKDTNDHSKWGVSKTGQEVTCFCDMNRMKSQQTRGGSCFCSGNPKLYKAFTSIIATTDGC